MPRFNGYSILLSLTLLTATACMNEDLNNSTYYESAWCVVQGRGSQISFVTDDKEILKPDESLDSIHFKTGDRYRVFYIPMENQSNYSTVAGAKLVKISGEPQRVLVEEVMPHAAFTGAINDPVWLNEQDQPFFGGGFLNFDFQFRSSNNPLILHGIHLLQDSLVNRKLYLRFGHHANGDVNGSLVFALASFPTTGLQHKSDADSLIILMRNDINDHSYRLALKDTL